jgi:predicted RNase H-like nuclease (RuvC/YqgF family)
VVSSEDILETVFKLAKKLKQTLADDERTAKPTKTSKNEDIHEMQLHVTKLKHELTKKQGKITELQSVLNTLKEVLGILQYKSYENLQCKCYEKLLTSTDIQRTKETCSLCTEQR